MSMIYVLVFFIPVFASSISLPSSSPNSNYNTDESGNVYMYINVIGHVKTPGTFMVYEGTEILTILSAAGGPLPGAKLNKITIYRDSDNMKSLDLDAYLNTGKKIDINFKPNDTIYIEQTLGSYLISKSAVLNSILTILNIYITVDQNN
jgi:hypothetical protein